MKKVFGVLAIGAFVLQSCSNGRIEFVNAGNSECHFFIGLDTTSHYGTKTVYLTNTSTSKVMSYTIKSGTPKEGYSTKVYKLQPGEMKQIGCDLGADGVDMEYSIVGERQLNE